MSGSHVATATPGTPVTLLEDLRSESCAPAGNSGRVGGLAIAAIAALAVTAILHVPVAVEHLTQVAYLGVAFYAFVVLCAMGIGSLLVQQSPLVWAGLGLLNLAAVAAYGLSRAAGLPGAPDDRGDWSNHAGIACVLAELVVVAVSIVVLRRWQRAR